MKRRLVMVLLLILNLQESYSMSTIIKAEGLEAEFLCQHPTDSGTTDWTIDGVYLRNIDTSDGSIRTEGRGAAVEALVIKALARYNRTEIVCITYARRNERVDVEYSTPARLLVQGQLNAVDHLKVTSSPISTPIQLHWTPPFSLDLNDTNPDVVYCVDIYEVTDVGLQRDLHIHVVSDCNVIEPQYSFTPANSDSLFQFIVTPRSNVPGAKNGTTNETYLFNTPRKLTPEDVEVIIDISNDTVTAMIHLPKQLKEIAGSRRPKTYEVTMESITDARWYTCPTVIDHNNIENITLILNCTYLLQPHQLFVVEIYASNPAGTSTILRDLELSTHFVQDVNTTSSALTPGMVNISCEFIASNTTILGNVALVYSKEEVHYLVTKNSNSGIVMNHLEGLGSDTYSTLLYAINESGLPLQQAVAFPRNVTITGSKIEGTHQDETDDNVFVTITHVNFQECLIECLFSENSTATACVTIYWKRATTTPYQLINFSSLKLKPQGGKVRGSIDTGDGLYHIAVFAFSDNMIHGKPVAKFYTGHKTGLSGQQDVTVTTVITTIAILVAIIAIVGAAAAVCYFKKERNDKCKETISKQPPSADA